MIGEVATRAVRLPEDGEFLFSLYAAIRRPEFSALGWSEAELEAFLRMQFDAQTRHYREWYSQAVSSVVLVGGQPVGRLLVDRSDEEICIVDIALLPQFRGAGVGGRLVRCLFEEADAGGLPIRCAVEQSNDARGFWEHLGLVVRAVDGAYVAMERACETSPR